LTCLPSGARAPFASSIARGDAGCASWRRRVETEEEFAFCRDAGFDLFQGYFYQRPELVRGRGASAARLGSVHTLAALQRARGSFERLDEVIRHDAGLSYKLIRFANSASIGARSPAGSVREAPVRLGSRTVQWATVLAMAGTPDRPAELLTTALLRARTCQTLAADAKDGCPDRAFVVALFAILDALLSVPMDAVLELLTLDRDVADALGSRSGVEGAALAAVVAYEHGTAAPDAPATVSERAVGAAYRDALAWTQTIATALT
jgi:c-di-GMP phosphodiesterase